MISNSAITTTSFQSISIDFQCPCPTLQNSTGMKFNDSQNSGEQTFSNRKTRTTRRGENYEKKNSNLKKKNGEKKIVIHTYTNTNIISFALVLCARIS